MKKPWILILVPILLITALYSAAGRVGWVMPIPIIAAQHGFLMVSGLFATLISFERTLILKQRWWLIIPLLSTASVVLVLTGMGAIGFGCQFLGAALLTLLYIRQWLQYREVFLLVLALSGLAWAASALVLLLGNTFPAATTWYILFLLYTIAAERLELSKFIATPPWAKPLLLVLFVLLFVTQAVPFHWGSNHITGLLLAGVGYWLLQFDIVKVNLKKDGFFYYTGSTLFVGYIWLMICGVLMALPLRTFYHYDAVLHSFFIGFTFSMLYAHAPIIFPALIGISKRPFHKLLYVPVWLTHALLLLRLYADYSSDWNLRKWIGLVQVFVILGYFLIFGGLIVVEKFEKTGIKS